MVEATGSSDIGDAGVDAFVDSNVISFAAWDLIAYVSQHPDDPRSLADFAHLLSRAEADVVLVLQRLTATGVLVESPAEDGAVYRLTEDAAVREVLSRFVELSARRECRLDFVRRVLGHVTPS